MKQETIGEVLCKLCSLAKKTFRYEIDTVEEKKIARVLQVKA